MCHAGSFSATGLVPCTACPIGTFSERAQQTICSSCPSGSTTQTTGANSSLVCSYSCPVGQASSTGAQPCTTCSVGFFQNQTAQTSCIPCPSGTSTVSVGASSAVACRGLCPFYFDSRSSSLCIRVIFFGRVRTLLFLHNRIVPA